MNPKVIITCAVTGAGDTVGKHPAIPVTPEQIANSALEAASAGEIKAAALLSGDGLNFTDAYIAVIKAWTAAARRPSGVERDETPLNRLWTSLRALWGRLWRRG